VKEEKGTVSDNGKGGGRKKGEFSQLTTLRGSPQKKRNANRGKVAVFTSPYLAVKGKLSFLLARGTKKKSSGGKRKLSNAFGIRRKKKRKKNDHTFDEKGKKENSIRKKDSLLGKKEKMPFLFPSKGGI